MIAAAEKGEQLCYQATSTAHHAEGGDDRLWHETDIPARTPDVRLQVQSGKHLLVPVVNQIRTYWWCSPPRTGRQRMVPASLTARETGASFSKDKCVLISL